MDEQMVLNKAEIWELEKERTKTEGQGVPYVVEKLVLVIGIFVACIYR